MKKNTKRLMVYILVGVIVSSAVMMSYNRAREVRAVAVVDDAAVLVGLLAAFGVYISYDWLTDGNNALDLYDDIEEAYTKARFEVIQGGAGGDPDEDPPEWEPLFNKGLDSGKLMLGASTVACLGEAAIKIWDKFYNLGSSIAENQYDGSIGDLPDEYFSEGTVLVASAKQSGVSPISIRKNSPDSRSCIVYDKDWDRSYIISVVHSRDGLADPPGFSVYSDGTLTTGLTNIFGGISSYDFNGYKFYLHFISDDHYKDIVTTLPRITLVSYKPTDDQKQVIYDYIFENIKPVIWTTPELQEDWENGKKPVVPEIPANNTWPIEIPSPDTLKQVDSALNPEADPDTGIKPEPDYDPLRDLINSLQPDFNPKPSPDPDPNPKPDPDNPGGDAPGTDETPFLADLKELFPFCIPFDLIHAFKVLSAEGSPPKWEVPVKIPMVGLDYTIVIDFKDFDIMVQVFRVMEVLLFIVGLIMATRSLIKG